MFSVLIVKGAIFVSPHKPAEQNAGRTTVFVRHGKCTLDANLLSRSFPLTSGICNF
jgi:hypothetical protein